MSDKPLLVHQIIAEGIRRAGAEGLCNPDLECGCELDDLIPCCSDPSLCRVAWKRVCEGCGDSFMVGDPNSEAKLCLICQET
jgi:hypothetical protein